MDADLHSQPRGLKPAHGDSRGAFDFAVPGKGFYADVTRITTPCGQLAVAVKIQDWGKRPEVPFRDPLNTPCRLPAIFERDHARQVYAERKVAQVTFLRIGAGRQN